ncbi:MAG: MAPEG family protein [Acidobacteria bacterium]|nr:MAPEG family protein [Acidobacteriota bacterium]
MPAAILLPAATLVAWSLVVWVWMLATRVPAMQKARMHPEKAKHTRGEVWGALPSEVRQVADNYNHLMEQPTIFYALVMVLAVSGEATMLDAGLAWAYAGLRIAHSLWQNTRNVVMIRFYFFIASTLVLFPMTGRALYLLLT